VQGPCPCMPLFPPKTAGSCISRLRLKEPGARTRLGFGTPLWNPHFRPISAVKRKRCQPGPRPGFPFPTWKEKLNPLPPTLLHFSLFCLIPDRVTFVTATVFFEDNEKRGINFFPLPPLNLHPLPPLAGEQSPRAFVFFLGSLIWTFHDRVL